jgi:hypothetical protein
MAGSDAAQWKLLLDSKDFQNGLKEATSQVKDFQSELQGRMGAAGDIMSKMGPLAGGVAAGLGILATGATAAGAAIEAMISHLASWGDHLTELGEQTGVNVEALQGLSFAAKLSGTTVEDMAAAINKMQKALVETPGTFERLHLSVSQLKAAAPEDAFLKVAEAIRHLTTPSEQAAAAIAAFGKAGASMLPAIKEGLSAAMEKARELGIVLSGEDVVAAGKLKDQTDTLSMAWEGLKNQFAATLVETGIAQAAIGSLTDVVSTLSHGVTEHKDEIAAFFIGLKTGATDAEGPLSQLADTIKRFADIETLGAFSKIGAAIKEHFTIPQADLDRLRSNDEMLRIATGQQTREDARYGANRYPGGRYDFGHADEQVVTGSHFAGAEEIRKAEEAAKKAEAAWRKVLEESKKAVDGWDEAFRDMTMTVGAFAEQVENKGVAAMAHAGLLGAGAMPGTGPLEGGTNFPIPPQVLAMQDQIDAKARAGAENARLMAEAMSRIEIGTKAGEQMVGLQEGMDRLKRGITDLRSDTQKWAEAMAHVSDAMHGIEAVTGMVSNLLGALGQADSRIGHIVAGIGQVASGVSSGMQAGSAFGPIGAAIGGAVGGITAIISLFHHAEWQSAMEDVGHRWGVSISEGLAHAIESTELQDHVSRQMAELLNIGAIMQEAHGDPSQFFGQINDLMNAVALGTVPAREGIDQLSQAFDQLKKSADEGSIASEVAMRDMIMRAHELGQAIPAMQAALKQMFQDAVTGLEAFYGGLHGSGKHDTVSSEQASANQEIFAAVFAAAQAQMGLLDAAKAMQKAFELMMAHMPKGTQLTGQAAEAAHLMDLLKDAGFSDASKAAAGLAQALKYLTDTTMLSQATLDALSQSAMTLYNQAKSAPGATDKDALMAILPLLIQLQKAQAMGAKLTPDEVRLLADAQKAGILPMLDVQSQQLGVQQQIRDGIYLLANKPQDKPGAPGEPGGGPGGGPGGDPGGDHRRGGANYATGTMGFRDFGRGMPAWLHGNEAVLPKSQLSNFIQEHGGAAGSTTVNHMTFNLEGSMNDEAALNRLARTITGLLISNREGIGSAVVDKASGAGGR